MKSIMHLFEELVKDKCGPNGVKILRLLEDKENVSEFVLSEKIDININELRILLYKLTEDNLIYSIRKKDKEKGWYIYHWTFNFRHARDLLIKYKEKKLEELKNKLLHKEIPKYVCPNGCVSINLEDAMEVEFKCTECNTLLNLKEVKYNEEILKKKISEIEEELEKIRKAVIIGVVPEEEVKKIKKKPVAKKKVKKKAFKKIKKKTKSKTAGKKIQKKINKKISEKKKFIKPKQKSKPVKKPELKKKPVKKKSDKKPEKKGFLGKIRRKIKF